MQTNSDQCAAGDEETAPFSPTGGSREITIDDLDPTWLRERVTAFRREHGAWCWRSPVVISVFFVLVVLGLGAALGCVLHLAKQGPFVFIATPFSFGVLAIACDGLLRLPIDSERGAAEAMLAHLRLLTDAPVLPLRPEYALSKFPNRIEPAKIRERAGLPNLWIPMRYADQFRSINCTRAYTPFLRIRLSREPAYGSRWGRFILGRVSAPASVLAALILFQILVLVKAGPGAILLFVGVVVLAVIMTARVHGKFPGSLYAQRIVEDQPCLVCGYSLKSLRHIEGTVARCPECGSSLTTLDICLNSGR